MSKRDSDYPRLLASSKREWKQRKRGEIRAVLADGNYLDRLVLGCAYCPAYEEIVEARRLLEIAKQKMSAKKWGR